MRYSKRCYTKTNDIILTEEKEMLEFEVKKTIHMYGV